MVFTEEHYILEDSYKVTPEALLVDVIEKQFEIKENISKLISTDTLRYELQLQSLSKKDQSNQNRYTGQEAISFLQNHTIETIHVENHKNVHLKLSHSSEIYIASYDDEDLQKLLAKTN